MGGYFTGVLRDASERDEFTRKRIISEVKEEEKKNVCSHPTSKSVQHEIRYRFFCCYSIIEKSLPNGNFSQTAIRAIMTVMNQVILERSWQ